MHKIPVGARHQEKLLVTSEVAIDFLGHESARVLATPEMIRWMERTCRHCIYPMLDNGYDSVGTHVNVRHLAAAPVGSLVTFEAEVTSVADRRVEFRVEAWDEQEKIGEGTHERFVVNVQRFASRLAQKISRVEEER